MKYNNLTLDLASNKEKIKDTTILNKEFPFVRFLKISIISLFQCKKLMWKLKEAKSTDRYKDEILIILNK